MKKQKKPALRLLIVLLILLVIAVAAMIFLFSSQDANSSRTTSQIVARYIVRTFYRNYSEMSAQEQNQLLLMWFSLVRKLAHFFEFLLLGIFLSLALHGLKIKKAPLITWISGTLYGALDELHQMAVDGRGPMWQDVCIDSGGVLVGILLGFLLLKIFHWIWPKEENTSPQPAPDTA